MDRKKALIALDEQQGYELSDVLEVVCITSHIKNGMGSLAEYHTRFAE
jgi:hypothetical protein